jgi:hypothetical protein
MGLPSTFLDPVELGKRAAQAAQDALRGGQSSDGSQTGSQTTKPPPTAIVPAESTSLSAKLSAWWGGLTQNQRYAVYGGLALLGAGIVYVAVKKSSRRRRR